jgi:hypothetical protein
MISDSSCRTLMSSWSHEYPALVECFVGSRAGSVPPATTSAVASSSPSSSCNRARAYLARAGGGCACAGFGCGRSARARTCAGACVCTCARGAGRWSHGIVIHSILERRSDLRGVQERRERRLPQRRHPARAELSLQRPVFASEHVVHHRLGPPPARGHELQAVRHLGGQRVAAVVRACTEQRVLTGYSKGTARGRRGPSLHRASAL